MSLPILIPVNTLDRAKGRLADTLTPDQRETLTLITLGTVLAAAGDRAIVLTSDEQVARFVDGKARVLREVSGRPGLNPQLEHAVELLRSDGTIADRLLILHADLPLVRSWTLDALIGEHPGVGSVTMVESADGGTNAMLLEPPDRFPLAYGAGSFARHRTAAAAAGLHVHQGDNRELELDLDTPADIATLLATARGQQTATGHYLLSLGFGQEGAFA